MSEPAPSKQAMAALSRRLCDVERTTHCNPIYGLECVPLLELEEAIRHAQRHDPDLAQCDMMVGVDMALAWARKILRKNPKVSELCSIV